MDIYVMKYETVYTVPECIQRITAQPQQFECEWGTELWYRAEKIGQNQVWITFTGGQFRKAKRTEYIMELQPEGDHTLVVMRFRKDLFGLPPMTIPKDIDLCMQQKLAAVRKADS